jgi:hypothetical protein
MDTETDTSHPRGLPITVSELWGGSTELNDRWRPVILRLSRELWLARDQLELPIRICVQVQVAGNVWQPDWEGVRTSTFDRDSRVVTIQATLPEMPPSDPFGFLKNRLFQAVELLGPWAKRNKVQIDVSPFLDLIGSL